MGILVYTTCIFGDAAGPSVCQGGPFAGLHQSEGNSLATFLSVTGGAFLSNWSRAPSQLDRQERHDCSISVLTCA